VGLDGRPVVPEAVAVVHELGQVMDLDGAADLGRGPLPGRAVIVALGPRGEATAALQGLVLRSGSSIVVMEIDSGQALDGCR